MSVGEKEGLAGGERSEGLEACAGTGDSLPSVNLLPELDAADSEYQPPVPPQCSGPSHPPTLQAQLPPSTLPSTSPPPPPPPPPLKPVCPLSILPSTQLKPFKPFRYPSLAPLAPPLSLVETLAPVCTPMSIVCHLLLNVAHDSCMSPAFLTCCYVYSYCL